MKKTSFVFRQLRNFVRQHSYEYRELKVELPNRGSANDVIIAFALFTPSNSYAYLPDTQQQKRINGAKKFGLLRNPAELTTLGSITPVESKKYRAEIS